MNLKSIISESEIIKYSSLIFLANFSGALILFISNIILSRHFGPEVFGNFKTILGLSLLLPSLIEFGAGVTIVKYTATLIKDKKKVNYLIKSILKLRVISYSLLLVLVFVLKDQIAIYLLKDISLSPLVIPGILISGLFFFEIFKSIALGFQEYKDYSVSKFLTFSSYGILILILGYFFGVYYALIGWALSYFIGNFSLIRLSIRRGLLGKTKKFDIKKVFLSYTLPMYILFFPELLSLVPIPILSLYYSQRIIGYYSFAMIFYNGIILIPLSLSDYLFPKISGLSGKKNRKVAEEKLKKVLLLYSLVVIPGIITTIFFSDFFIELIAPLYVPSILIFKILVCLGLLSGYFLIYENYLRGLARLKRFALMILTRNITFLIFSFFVLMTLV